MRDTSRDGWKNNNMEIDGRKAHQKKLQIVSSLTTGERKEKF